MSDEYNEKAGQIRQLASLPPDQLVDHFSNLHNTLDSAAPNIAPHVYSTAANAIQFLNGKLPSHGNEMLQDQSPGPSQAQQNAWLSLHKTVDDPLSVLDHVKQGTLNSHHIEALQSVYPDLHQEMIQKTMEQLGQMKDRGKSLPYPKRVAISKFIGQPLDSTLTPQSYQAILGSSQNQAPTAPTQKKNPKKASGAELDQIDKVNQLYQTPLQARQSEPKK